MLNAVAHGGAGGSRIPRLAISHGGVASERCVVRTISPVHAVRANITRTAKRQSGGWPGSGDVPDSVWFDPLPEDQLAAWEGRFSNIL